MNEEIKKEMQDKIELLASINEYEMPLKEWQQKYTELMHTYVGSGDLYNFYVKCDEENNIYLDKEIKVVDIYIEPRRGQGIFVNQITIQKNDAKKEDNIIL